MLLVNTEQARSIDSITINKYDVPGLILMENAGMRLADAAFDGSDKVYTVVCGKGNNGGDGSVAARHLLARGADVCIVLACSVQQLSGDALCAFELALKFGVPVIEGINETARIRIMYSDAVIDAVLGIGCKNAPEGAAEDAVRLINGCSAKIYSADVPSGINCDTGAVCGEAVSADETITFGYAKTGLVLYPARLYAGKVTVADISFSHAAARAQNINVQTIESYTLPRVEDNAFKGTRGRLLAIAGSTKYGGAAYMSSYAALRSGCGLVTLAYPKGVMCSYTNMCPELICRECASDGGCFARKSASDITALTHSADAVIAGCGTGVTEGTRKIVHDLILNYDKTLVLDADGINCIASSKHILADKKCDIIITPHIGEMARFLGTSTKEISDNMIETAKNAAGEYNITVVLKSASTVIAMPDGRVYVNTYGTSGMATAGSGDVLTGIIGSFAAQGMSPTESAVNGVAVHALSGSAAEAKNGKHYMNATDIIAAMSSLDKDDKK